MTMALELRDVSAGYSKEDLVSGISLTLAAGESLCIIGLNGAGKTTLLKVLTGLNAPRHGTAKIFGIDAKQSRAREQFAFLPERFVPCPVLNGFEVLRLTALAYGVAYNRNTAMAVSQGFGLSAEILRQRVKNYSKGMAQKLGLAGALYCQCRMLILDEPFSGLDPLARRDLKQALRRYRESGGTLVFTSHLLSDIEELSDRLMILHKGEQAFNGKTSDLLAHSSSDADKTFLDVIASQS